MKKLFFTIMITMCVFSAFAQQRTVAVAGFDVQGGITQEEAAVVYELFVAQLVSTGTVAVVDRVNLDTISTEMRFQASDWSNPEKTASLGKVLNAEIIIHNRLMRMGGSIYWTASMLDLNTARVMFSARDRLTDIGQVWNRLPDFCRNLVAGVNQPNPHQALLPVVAISTFDVQGGVTPEEAGVITELFISSLVSTRQANVIDRTNFDKIVEEMQFQTTDWSNREKTVALGRVMNAQYVIRGQLMKMGSTIYWTANLLDGNTAQIITSSRQQLNNLNDVWGSNLTNFSREIVAQLRK